ncbi:MAG: halocyanin domain-containing protein [Natronomonas sp.]
MERTDRRTLLKVAGAAVTTTAIAGCMGDDEEEPTDTDDGDTDADGDEPDFLDEEPDYGDWFDDVPNYEGTVDMRGHDEVVVLNGAGDAGQLFEPPAIAVDPGTTVVWEWTGRGGAHNVAAEDDSFKSEMLGEEGHEFEYTFEEEGITRYVCEPHVAVGMKGAVVVQ